MHRVEWVLQLRDRSPTFLSTARRQLFIALVFCGVGGERGLPLGWGRYLRVGRVVDRGVCGSNGMFNGCIRAVRVATPTNEESTWNWKHV